MCKGSFNTRQAIGLLYNNIFSKKVNKILYLLTDFSTIVDKYA